MENKDGWIIYSKFIINKKEKNGDKEETIKYAKDKFNLNIDIISSHDFYVSCEKEGISLYYKGIKLNKLPKFVIFRKYDIYLARQLEMLGVTVLNNSQSMIDARNKMKTYQMLSKSNISIPKTLYIVSGVNKKEFSYEEVCKYFNSNKFILKYVYGSRGNDIHLIEDKIKFNETVKKYNGICIFQEYIESSYGKDIRCYIIGGKFVGCAVRQSHGDFRSNLAQGGEAVKFDAPDKVKELALNSAKIMNLDICGVDILFGNNDEYYVCEVNSLPGFKSINTTTNIRANDLLLELLYNKLMENK